MQQAGDVKELTAGLIRIGTFSSVATHWLPSIIREFQKDYPNIEYEFLLGDYREIEAWIREGRVDCGFLCLPVRPDLDTIFLERDDFLATLPTAHPLAQAERIFLDALCKEPFLILEKDKNAAMTKIRAGMMAGGRLELSTMPRTYSPVMRRSRHTPLMVHAMIRIR